MTAVEFASTVLSMSNEKQNEFFNKLKTVLSEEDWKTTVLYISSIDLLTNPAKYKAVRTAVCEELFGLEVPFSVKTPFDF